MSTLTAGKLLKYGAVCFVPATSFDTVSGSMTYQGQTIQLLEPSEQLPGFLAWFNPGGMTSPSTGATDPGLDTTGNEPLQMKPPKNNGKKAASDGK